MRLSDAVASSTIGRRQQSLQRPTWLHTLRRVVGGSAAAKAFLRWLYTRLWLLPRQHGLIARYLAQHPVRRLELGCSFHWRQGWLCTDLHAMDPIVYLDVGRPFPLPDASIDYIYNEHMIEHIPYELATFMLHECFRVLKPGGRIRVATPDLAMHVALTTAEPTGIAARYVDWMNESSPIAHRNRPGFALNRIFYDWGHQFIYDHQTLPDLFERAGFIGIDRKPVGVSGDSELVGLEMHGEHMPPEFNELSTMVYEAVKPR